MCTYRILFYYVKKRDVSACKVTNYMPNLQRQRRVRISLVKMRLCRNELTQPHDRFDIGRLFFGDTVGGHFSGTGVDEVCVQRCVNSAVVAEYIDYVLIPYISVGVLVFRGERE